MTELTDNSQFGAHRRTPVTRRGSGLVATLPRIDTAADMGRGPGQFGIDEALRVVARWKWLILAATLVGVALAVVLTMTATRLYRAEATIEINVAPTQIMGNDQQAQNKVRNTDQYLQTQYGLLRSRSLAERVVRNLNLASDPAFAGGKPGRPANANAAAYRVMGGLQVQPQRGSSLVTLGYVDIDPVRAQRIVNAYAQGFIAETTEQHYDATAFARAFLQERLTATRAKLEESERLLVNYAQNKGILQLDQVGGDTGGKGGGDGPTTGGGDSLSAQSLTTLNAALAAATNERIVAEQRYRQAAGSGATSDLLQNQAVQSLRAERAKLAADYRDKQATFKPDYPEMVSLRARIDQIDRDLGNERVDVTSALRSTFLAARGHEQELRAQVAGLRSSVLDLRNRGIGYNTLQRDVSTNRALYDALLQRFKEIGVVGNLGEAQATVIDTATLPTGPFKPRPMFNAAVGLILGLVVGLAAAFGIEVIDDTIKSPDDVTTKLRLTTLGMIPMIAKPRTLVEELADPKSAITDAYHSVVAALQFATEHGLPRTILVASSRAAEGKSSTSLSVAQNLSRIGASVLLIDADMRNPSFRSGVSDRIGLSQLLVNTQKLTDHVIDTNVTRLSLLPAGAIPPNPAELLGTGRIRALIEEAAAAFDVVVIDAPPVLGLADTPILASLCQATLMIVETASVRRTAVLSALSRLRGADAHIAGVVLSKFDARVAGYGYGYGYGYGGDKPYGAEPRRTAMLDVTS